MFLTGENNMHGNCDEGWADVNINFALVYFLIGVKK